MAHQDITDLQSVKPRQRWHRTLTARLSRGAVEFCAPGGNSGQQRRPLDPTRPSLKDGRCVSFGRCDEHSAHRRQLRGRCVRSGSHRIATIWCSQCFSREAPTRPGFWRYLQSGSIECRKCAGCGTLKRLRSLSGERGSIGALEATPVRSRRVRNHACRGA